MRTFIDHLKRHSAGRVFWVNLCAHLHEGCVDFDTVQDVLKAASKAFSDNYPHTLPTDPGAAAFNLLNAETFENKTAIGSIRNVRPIDWGDVDEVSTIVNQTSFWKYYVDATANGHKAVLDTLSTKVGPLDAPGVAGRIESLLLEECFSNGQTDLLAVFADSAIAGGKLKTWPERFWISKQDAKRSRDADDLIRQLALAHFEKDHWVIEIVYALGSVQRITGETVPTHVARPSALCVNDTNKPRFRALRPDEIGRASKAEPVDWHGTTINLSDWRSSAAPDMNGLPELMCPGLTWGPTSLPDQITLIGPVQNEIDRPNNDEYAAYLEKLFQLAIAKESEFIDRLAA